VTYQMPKALEIYEKWSLPIRALTTFDDLCDVALREELIDSKGLELLRSWRADPKAWSV
jgi:hypothetical protein